MSLVILQPSGSKSAFKHFIDTVQNKVKLSNTSKYLSENEFQQLSSIYPDGDTQIWGVTPGKNNINKKKWDRISRGDITLFAGKGKIFSSGITTYKLHNHALAKELWGNDDEGNTWEFIYFLDEVYEQNIPYSVFNKIVGYEKDNIIRGFTVLDNKKSDLLTNEFGLLSNTYSNVISLKEYNNLLDSDSLDNPTLSNSRKEQVFLRDYLIGSNTQAKCCICHKTFPVQFLIASHLKKRTSATLKEKKDFKNIVALMCSFGCDDLYERGYISVNDELIIINKNKNTTKDLEQYRNQIVGKKCLAWNENTMKYFQWHQAFHGVNNLK